ncbi:NACHT domain-containing protein [Fusarium sp. LHS14.1]|nr:NACHT domain-containing protein [Fusarium sp. LHS14.1]
MDPLSISASIAGLVAVADLVFRHSTKYLNGARKEAEDISHEVKNLSIILHNLSLVAFELEETQSSDSTQQKSNLKPHHLHDCQQLLRRLEQGLVSTQPNLGSTSRIERLQSRLAWPFSSSDTKEILRDVRRHKQTIKLALEADTLSNLRLLLSRQSDANSRISHIQETVNKIYDIQTSIRLDEKRQKVLEFFTKANPRSELDTNRNLRHSLTGLWLTEGPEFEEWYTTPGSKIWCSGIPGAGKSVLAAAMIDECLQRNVANPCSAMAYFFCVYRDEETQDPVSILSSLCSQLARQDEMAFLILEEYYHELTSERQLQSGPSAKKLIKVLRKLCSLIDRVYIIVDGLDECGKRAEETVESLAALLPSNIDEGLNIALLSRNEVPIREVLGDKFQNIEIEAHTEDIQLYVASELKQRIESKKMRLRDLALKDVIMARLVEGAKGMFRWVACQLDHLCELPTDRARRKALDKLPPTLFATYEQILTRINNSGEENKQLVQKTLLFISSPHHGYLNLRQICEALSLQDGDEELVDEDIIDGEEVLRLCGSLIRTKKSFYYTEDDSEVGIEFSHFSVQEYLQDECFRHATLSAYGVSRQKACQLLASLCLGYLTLKNEEQLPETTTEMSEAMYERDLRHPFYRHAATYWLFYVREAGEGCCLERIHDLFQVQKTPNFCMWATTLVVHCVLVARELMSLDSMSSLKPSFRDICMPFHLSDLVRPDFTPLHVAAILGIPDLCRHLLSQGADLDLKGKFGTPLHGAIAGLGTFLFGGDFSVPPWVRFLSRVYGIGEPLGRFQAAQVLLEAGAKTQLLYTGHWEGSYSYLSISALTSSFGPELEIAVELIKTGINIEEEDLACFAERYEEMQSMEYNDISSQAVLKLLEALGPPDTHTKTTPKALLYNKTLHWAARMKIASLSAVSTYQPMSEASDDEIFDFIFSWVQSNDVIELGRFLKGHRSELVTSARFDIQRLDLDEFLDEDVIYQDSTPLHLAAHHNSLDALDTLIDHGFDANIAAPDGKSPVHMCCHQDALRALLRHGASTLVSDNTQETIWHTAAHYGQVRILEVLVELNVRQEALQMVSSREETPICSALNAGQENAVLFLLKYCNSREFWKSGESIFRAAAKIGSSEIVKHLLDVGIEVDGTDDITGSPLHYVSTTATVECIALLKCLFPLDQRRKEDHRTPLESLLLQATGESTVLEGKVLEAMLPGNALSCPHEASSLWSFVGSEVAKSALISPECSSSTWTWLTDFVLALIELGIMAKYEATGRSALRPFASFPNGAGTGDATNIHQEAVLEGLELSRYSHWLDFSRMVLGLAREAKRWDIAVSEPEVVRLLAFSILHDDKKMISLLVDKGVDIHSRADVLSPFEFACFPNVPISERSFAILLEHAALEKMTERNEKFDGCGSLHFIAGWTGRGRACTWKLRQMLSAGVDPCSPLSPKRGSPLAHHLHNGALNTAEILLESGADPWASGRYSLDASLEAAQCGSHSILKKIAASDHGSACWDRIWWWICGEQVDGMSSGGNALHLAAINGNTGCLEFYLNQGLLSDLECHDYGLETPMHYAARFDQFSTIKWLKARGGNINARNRDGWTPLHLAAKRGHLETARTLIRLGAKHQACNRGCVPLVYAYSTGNAAMIETLQNSSGELQESNSPNKSPMALKILAEAMRNAILRSDVSACERILALGCPVDVELYDEVPVTLLAVAICHQQDPKVVQWLMDAGATVSTIFPQPYQDEYSTALEAAIAHPRFNSILYKLLNKFLEEGGNFLDMARGPLHLAIDYDNIEGLRTLLDWLRETYGSSGSNLNRLSGAVENKSSQSGTVSAFIDQKDAQDQETALHVAASKNNVDACAVLVSSLANIEETNIRNETPLHLAAEHGSLQVAKHLLDCGAHPNLLDVWDETPLMRAYQESQWELVDLLTPYCKDMARTTMWGGNILHFMAIFEPDPTRAGLSGETLSRCIEQGASLHLPGIEGVAPVHCILAKQSAYHLRFLLNRDHRFLRPQETAHWPGDWFFASHRRLAVISKNLRLVQPFLSNHELRQLCVIAQRGDHSLLCRAACWGSVEAIESLLALGVDMIEHQCKDHGTPLAAAISRGHIKAVKCLVSNGAAVPYDLCQPNDFEVSVGKPDFVIQQWLFVGRHVEQSRISDVVAEASGKIESWAGVRTARVALKWEWKRHRGEEIWEYACRRQKILKDVRGKVVKCLEETTEGESASSDASDEKFSGRHYCLGRGRIRGAMLVY